MELSTKENLDMDAVLFAGNTDSLRDKSVMLLLSSL